MDGRICKVCGISLEGQRGRGRRRRFCSDACKMRAYRRRKARRGSARLREQAKAFFGDD